MTRSDLMTAHELRRKGKTWAEIGEAMNYDPSTVRKGVRKIFPNRRRKRSVGL